MTMMEARLVRMGGLIDNVMDFARTRMGAGLKVRRPSRNPCNPCSNR